MRAYNKQHSIASEAYSPIAQGKVLDDPVITRIAGSAGRSPAQVVLRWHIQRGDVVIPKSVTPERIQANFEVFDYELSNDEVEAIAGLDRGENGRTGAHPDTFDYVPG